MKIMGKAWMAVGLAVAMAGCGMGCHMAQHETAPTNTVVPAAAGSQVQEAVYTCPMHSEIREAKAGRCPKCGMDLVPAAK